MIIMNTFKNEHGPRFLFKVYRVLYKYFSLHILKNLHLRYFFFIGVQITTKLTHFPNYTDVINVHFCIKGV